MTRAYTPDRFTPEDSRTVTVQHACNTCGTPLDAVLDGQAGPDARDECARCERIRAAAIAVLSA